MWDRQLSNVKTDTVRRTEAKNDPYNPINYAIMLRGLLGIIRLNKKRLNQYGNIPSNHILNSDFSIVNLGKKLETETIMATAKNVKEQRAQGSNVRATKLTRSAICQQRSLN